MQKSWNHDSITLIWNTQLSDVNNSREQFKLCLNTWLSMYKSLIGGASENLVYNLTD